jgi:hypothetical protein
VLIAYYFMWHAGHPALEQCAGCTFYTSQVRERGWADTISIDAAVRRAPWTKPARFAVARRAGRRRLLARNAIVAIYRRHDRNRRNYGRDSRSQKLSANGSA